MMKTTIRNFVFYTLLLMALFGLFASCLSAPASTSSYSGASSSAPARSSSSDRQAVYMQHLRENGYSPSIDSDGDITFRYEGRSYYILIGSSDPTLMILLLPSIASVNNSTRNSAAVAISYVGQQTKVAKAFLTTNNYISLSVEVFLEDANDFGVLLSRYMRILSAAEDNLREKM